MRLIRIVQPTFTVSAAAVVLNAKREVLLLDHFLRPSSGWGLPGGFLDKNEQPEDAIRRELREETGIELADLRMLGVRTLGRHIETLFAATTSGDPQVLSREIRSLGWYAADSLPDGFPHGQRIIIERVLAGEV